MIFKFKEYKINGNGKVVELNDKLDLVNDLITVIPKINQTINFINGAKLIKEMMDKLSILSNLNSLIISKNEFSKELDSRKFKNF